jgi:hypothetical protein
LPSVVDDSFNHDGLGEMPAVKNSNGEWDLRGHARRVVKIDETALMIMRDLVEDEATPFDQTRFVMPHSRDTLAIFKAMCADSIGFTEGAGGFKMDPLWHESGAQKDSKAIKRETSFPSSADEMILTGPIFYVGNPLYKTPNRIVRSNKSNEAIDLSEIQEDYLPRTNYKPAMEFDKYEMLLSRCRWNPEISHADQYRIAFRRMLPPQNERTLIASLIPPGFAHVNTVESLAFQSETKLIGSYPAWISLPFDFLVKSTGLTDFREASLRHFPWVVAHATAQHRALRLSCLTNHFSNFWNKHAAGLEVLPWSSDDARIHRDGPANGPNIWDRSAGLRTDFARRLALVEIDVLVAISLGLSLDHLIDMYRISFPVLKQNEEGTWYDQNGRLVWTCSKGLVGTGFLVKGKSPSRKAWENEYAGRASGTIECGATTDFLPDGPHKTKRVFEAPFTRCDRIADYRQAWAHFERLGVKRGGR